MSHISTSRQKIEIETDITSERIYNSEYSVDEFIEKINGLKERGATHVALREEYAGEGTEAYFDAVVKREETEEEYSHRMEQLDWIEKKRAEKQEAIERIEFERLKKKFPEA